jgi:acylphosphatase
LQEPLLGLTRLSEVEGFGVGTPRLVAAAEETIGEPPDPTGSPPRTAHVDAEHLGSPVMDAIRSSESGSEVIAREVAVFGRVQGVFFRATCKEEAERSGASGWARNESDGSVRALFEGPTKAVESMLDWCGRGPSGAVVDRTQVVERKPSGVHGFSLE